jgi:hypothetical protein
MEISEVGTTSIAAEDEMRRIGIRARGCAGRASPEAPEASRWLAARCGSATAQLLGQPSSRWRGVPQSSEQAACATSNMR